LSARKTLFRIARLLLVFPITLLLLEGCLRLFPSLIPPFLLVDFNPQCRETIAARLGFPTEATVRFLDRSDGGPPRRMRLFRPRAEVTLDVGDDQFVRTVVMDEEGFCNDRWSSGAEPRRRELVALGDSFTWCTGVEPDRSWPAVVASRIDVSAINLGSPGIGLYEHLEILRRFGVPRQPRFVVLSYYEGNDLRDAQSFHVYRQAVGAGADARARRVIKGRPLGRYSYAYNLVVVGSRAIHHGFRKLLFRMAGVPTGEEPQPDFRYRLRLPGGDVAFNTGNVDQDEVRAARALRSGDLDPAILAPGLEELMRLAKQHRFVPVVAYTPSAYTAYEGRVEFQDPDLAELMPWFSRRQREYLARKAEEMCFAFVDLTPEFQRAARDSSNEELLFFPGVLHLTARGHEVAAGALASALRGLPSGGTMTAGSPPPAIPAPAGKDRP
jgi:hypothetical protein